MLRKEPTKDRALETLQAMVTSVRKFRPTLTVAQWDLLEEQLGEVAELVKRLEESSSSQVR